MLSRSYFNSARLTITAVKSKHDVDACAWMIYLQHHNKNYNYKHKEKEEEGEEIVDAWLHAKAELGIFFILGYKLLLILVVKLT
jgi:hypothetical protein